MTLKDLKSRLQPGVTLLLVRNLRGPVGKIRTVSRTQTTGVWFRPESEGQPEPFLPWPKAHQVIQTTAGFAILGDGGGTMAEYEWK